MKKLDLHLKLEITSNVDLFIYYNLLQLICSDIIILLWYLT